jgi:SAM-dependent methyltransferase
MELTNARLVDFLSEITINTSFFNKLKIRYRPYLCPFVELLSLIEDNVVVADIGCGSGQFLLLATRFRNPANVIGIEVSEELIFNAQELFKRYPDKLSKFITFDGLNMPADISQADVIFLIDVLHHVPSRNQDQFLRNIISVMKKGARLVLKDIEASSFFVYVNKLHDFVFAGEVGVERSSSDIIKLLKKENVQTSPVIHKQMLLYPHYTIVSQK